jgi:hypothetical protein
MVIVSAYLLVDPPRGRALAPDDHDQRLSGSIFSAIIPNSFINPIAQCV